MHRSFIFGLVVAGALGGHASVARGGISDEARMFSPPAVASAEEVLRSVEQKTGWKVIVRTVESISGDNKAAGLQRLIEEAHGNPEFSGLVIALSKADHKVEVQASPPAFQTFPAAGVHAVRDAIVEGFKSGKPDQGLSRATEEIRKLAEARPRSSQRVGVEDDAHLFEPETIQRADDQLRKLQKSANWDVRVQTVESLDGVPIEQAAIRRAEEAKIHGLMILIAKKEHKTFVQPSRDAHDVFDQEQISAVVETLDANFKVHQYNKGLLGAVNRIFMVGGPKARAPVGSIVTLGKPGGGSEDPGSQPEGAPAPGQAKPGPVDPFGGKLPMYLAIGAGGLLVLWLLTRMGRAASRPPAGTSQAGYPTTPGGPQPGYGAGPRPSGYGPQSGPPGGGYAPGYPPQQQAGGGGFLSGALGGLGGAIAGNILYDKFGRPHNADSGGHGADRGGADAPYASPEAAPTGWQDAPGTGNEPDPTYDPSQGAGGEWGGSEPAATDGGWAGGDSGAGGDWGDSAAPADDGGSWGTPPEETGAGGDWGGTPDDGGAGGEWGGGSEPEEHQGGDW